MIILKNIKKINDIKTNKINKLTSPKKKYRIDFLKGGKNNRIMALYEENKMIISGEYNFYGIFQPNTKLWIWASSIPGVHIKHIKNIRKIKESEHLFESDNDTQMMFYYQLLTQDSILITDSKMLNWINDLILYLSDDFYYFNPTNSEGNIQFLTMISIKEKYT